VVNKTIVLLLVMTVATAVFTGFLGFKLIAVDTSIAFVYCLLSGLLMASCSVFIPKIRKVENHV
jgi:hypothetical protein